jgi:hypothetical protein
MSGEPNYGHLAADLGQRIKAMLSPYEDVCRYREQRNEDFSSFDVRPRNRQALPFTVAVAPGGVNIDTPVFSIREFPLTEARVAEQMVEAILLGHVHRVTRLSAAGKLLAAKAYLFGRDGLILFKHRSRAGLLAGLTRAARRERIRFAAYRAS